VAGSWYPGSAAALSEAVDRYLAAAHPPPAPTKLTTLTGLIAPHAGLIYSGPVAAFSYRLLQDRPPEVVVMVGPSHFVGFEGVALYPGDGFETPLGTAVIDREIADALAEYPFVLADSAPHAREHSLEMQLPFIRRVAPAARIVPLVMGHQSGATARALGEALAAALANRDALMVASTDLSHYHDAATARTLDATVIEHVSRFDADGLQRSLDRRPEHACGGGPMVAVMRAAAQLGARDAVVLRYADSGDVSGDKSAVVGYLAAALGTR
jgi:AmmeMemoRadiSam system protein B